MASRNRQKVLNWTSFDKSIEEAEQRPDDDVLELYQTIRANIGATISTIRLGEEPTQYIALEDLISTRMVKAREDGKIDDSVYTKIKHFTSLVQLPKNDRTPPARDLILNLGKLEQDVLNLDERNPKTEFYNALHLGIRRENIPTYAADFNGASKVVLIEDLVDTGVHIPLQIVMKYCDKRVLIDEETAEQKYEEGTPDDYQQQIKERDEEIDLLRRHIEITSRPHKKGETRVYEKIRVYVDAGTETFASEVTTQKATTYSGEQEETPAYEKYPAFDDAIKRERFKQLRVEEIEQQRAETDAPYEPLINAALSRM